MKISETMQALRAKKCPGFIPYLTVGDPDLETSLAVILELSRAGADVIELGVPFSDPVADGPVNQRAAERALKKGVKLADVLGVARKARDQGVQTPFLIFTYLNPILAMGVDRFAEAAAAAGVGGALVVDLPPEEGALLTGAFRRHSLENVFLAAPTTHPGRLPAIDAASTAFLYYVSRVGVTGAQASLSESLQAEMTAVRGKVKNPVAIGFGISTPEQAREAAKYGDAVVIGSAIVRMVEESVARGDRAEQTAREVGKFARSVREALDAGGQGRA